MTDQSPRTTDNTSEPDTIQPVPAWIKQGGLALLAIIILLIIWMIFSGHKDNPVPNLAELESSENPEPNKPELQRQMHVNPSSLTFSENKMSVFNEDALPQTDLQHDYQLLKQQITRLQDDVKRMDARFIQEQKRQDDVTDMLKKLVEIMQEDVTTIKNMLKKQAVSHKKRIAYKRIKRTKAAEIPLTLVSIDQWGNDYYAVIRYQGHLEDIVLGQTIAGWTLDSIHHQQGKASFRNAQGITRFLSVM